MVPIAQFSVEEAARSASWQRLYVSQPEGFKEERMVAELFGFEG